MMKRLIRLSIPLLALGLTVGCDIAKSTNSRAKFQVRASSSDPCETLTQEIDLKSDPAVKDVIDKVGDVTLDGVTVTITQGRTQPNSLGQRASGRVMIAGSDPADNVEVSTFADVPLQDGATQNLNVSQGASKKLAELIKKAHKFTVVGVGCAEPRPAYFEFEVELRYTVHGSLL